MKLSELNRVTGELSNHSDTLNGIDDLFRYHPWDIEKIDCGNAVRDALKGAYHAILANVPPSPSRTRALNCVTDARMLANAAITFDGEV